MGTNFYAVIKPGTRSKDIIKNSANRVLDALEKNYDELEDAIMELKDNAEVLMKHNKVHLGKRSYGWAFLWDLNNGEYYSPTLKSIEEFVKKENATIEDEYGKAYTWDEFIGEELKGWLYPDKAKVSIKEVRDLFGSDKMGRADWVISNYITKGLPYYQYCTGRTYREMHPDERDYQTFEHYISKIKESVPNIGEYVDESEIDLHYSDFITKDGLRFAVFTDFS